MLYFPQLATGALVQYPLVKRRAHRTITSELADGRRLKLLDPGAVRVEWDLTFESLSNTERLALESFFESVEGRLGEFVLLDPTGNLLLQSEDLNEGAWTRGPMLALTEGIADSSGGMTATRLANAGEADQNVQQTVQGPGWFHYCFSFFARSGCDTELGVYRSAGGATTEETRKVGPVWRRIILGGASESQAESVTFGLSLPPGASVEVHGFQLEAQPAPSVYHRTTTRTGVYTGARFDNDALMFTTEGPEQHGCKLRIVAPAAS